jgi:hypothetical protein
VPATKKRKEKKKRKKKKEEEICGVSIYHTSEVRISAVLDLFVRSCSRS